MMANLTTTYTPLVLVANEAYAVGLAVKLHSLVQFTQPLPEVFVVDTGLAPDSRSKLEQVAPVHWIELPQRDSWRWLQQTGSLQATATPSGGTAAAYPSADTWVKLLLPQLLPAGLQRVLYMDCDMMARCSLQPVLTQDLQGRMLAAVRDVGLPCGPPQLRHMAGWAPGQPYFNAGLLLLDLEVQKMRAASGAIQNILLQHGRQLPYHDQDVLNLLLCPAGTSTTGTAGGNSCVATGWLELPLRWNAQGVGTYARFRTAADSTQPALFGSTEELRNYEQHPAVVHFTGPPAVPPSQYLNPWVPYTSKPWAYLCQHPYRDRFYQMLDSTPWQGWRPGQGQVAEECAREIGRLLEKVAAEQPGFDQAQCKQLLLCLLQQQE